MTLHIEKLDGPEALEMLAPEWESLDAQISPRTPFTSPLWIGLWWRHFQRTRAIRRDEFYVHTMRERNGQLAAIAPLMISHRPAFGPLRLRFLRFMGADPTITELRGVICRPERQAEVIQELSSYFHNRNAERDLFSWNGIRSNASVNGLLRVSSGTELPAYILPLPETWEKLRLTFSSNMRKTVRKCYEVLERDGHSFVLRVVERPADVPTALERFFMLHSARANAAEMVMHPDKFSARSNRAFLVDYI